MGKERTRRRTPTPHPNADLGSANVAAKTFRTVEPMTNEGTRKPVTRTAPTHRSRRANGQRAMAQAGRRAMRAMAGALALSFLFLVQAFLFIPLADAQSTAAWTLSTHVAGENADYSVAFNTQLFGGDAQLTINFPDAGSMPYATAPNAPFTGVTAVLSGNSATNGAAKSESAQVVPGSGNTLAIKRAASSAGDPWKDLVTLRLHGVVNPLWAGTTSSFTMALACTGCSGTTFTYTGITFAAAQLRSPQVKALTVNGVGQASDYQFDVQTNTTLPTGTYLRVRFPRDYDFTAVTPVLVSQQGFCTSTPPSISSATISPFNYLRITQNSQDCSPSPAPPGYHAISVIVNGLVNPRHSVPSDGFVVQLLSTSNVVFASTATDGILFQPSYGYVSSPQATAADLGAGASSVHTVQFTTNTAWPAAGKLVVYLPPSTAGKNVFRKDPTSFTASLEGPGCSGAFGAAAIALNEAATVITLPRSAAQGDCTAGVVVVTLANLLNPGLPGSYSTMGTSYSVAIEDGIGLDLQALNGAAAHTIGPGVPNSFVASWSGSPHANNPATVQLSFNLRNDWPKDGTATVDFPDGFTINQPSASWSTACTSPAGVLLATANAKRVTLSRAPDGGGTPPSPCAAGANRVISLTGISVPPKAGNTKPIVMSFYSADTRIESSSPTTVPASIVLPELSSPNDKLIPDSNPFPMADSVAAGDTTTYHFAVRYLGNASAPWQSTDRFAIGFPPEYVLSGVGSTVRVTGSSLGANPCVPTTGINFASTLLPDNTLLLQRPAGATACTDVGRFTFNVTGVKNPLTLGATGFYVATRSQGGLDQRALGNNFGAVLNPNVQLTAGVLPGAAFLPSNKAAGANALFTVSFTSPFAVPSTGRFVLTFPPTFSVSNPGVQGTFTGCDGAVTGWSASNPNTVTVTRSLSTTCPAGPMSFTVTGATNPSQVGSTAPFWLDILSQPSVTLAMNHTINPVRIDPVQGALSLPSFTISGPNDYVGAKAVTYVASFYSSHGIPGTSSAGKVRLTLPKGLDLTNVGLGATGPGGCGLALDSIAGSPTTGWTVLVKNTASDCAAGATYSVALTGIDNPAAMYPGKPLAPFGIVIQKAGIDQEEAAASQVALRPGSLNEGGALGISVLNNKVLSNTSYQFQFNSINPWPKDGKLVVRFPSGYDLLPATKTHAPAMVGCPSGFTSTPVRSAGGRNLTLVRDGLASSASCSGPGTVMVQLNWVTNPASTSPATFDIELQDATGLIISAAYAVAAPTLAPSGSTLNDLTIETRDHRAGAATPLWANFTSFSTWPADGKFVLVMPTAFGISGANLASFVGCDGGFALTVSPSAHSITVARDASGAACTPGAKVVRLNGIMNPTVSGTTSPLSLMLKDANGGDLDANNQRTLVIAPGALSVPSLSAASTVASAVTTYTATLSPTNPWPADGTLVVTLPAGYGLGSVTAASIVVGGASTPLGRQTSVSPGGRPMMTLTRTGGATSFASATLTISGLTNPTASGPTSKFLFNTTDAAGNVIDAATGPTMTISPKGYILDAPTIQVDDGAAGHAAVYTLSFAPRSQIPATGCFRVSFPSDFSVDLSQLSVTVTISGSNVPVVVKSALPAITLARQNGLTALDPGPTAIVLHGITNPAFSGSAIGPINAITLESGTGNDCLGTELDGAFGGTVPITPSTFVGEIASLTDYHAAAPSDYRFVLTGTPDWSNDLTLAIAVPADFDLAGVLASASSPDSSACMLQASVPLAGHSILVTRQASAGCPAGPWSANPKTFRILGLKNSPVTDVSHAFSLQFTDANNRAHSTAANVAVPALLPLGGALSDLTAAAQSAQVDASTPYTIGFTTHATWPQNAGLRVRFPTGYDVSAVVPTTQVSPDSVGTLTASSIDSNTILLTRVGEPQSGPLPITLVLGGVRNPHVSGAPGAIQVATLSGDGADLDVGQVAAPTISGANLGTTIAAGSRLAGSVDTYTFTFTTQSAWPGSGFVAVTFPGAYGLGSVVAKSLTGCGDGLQGSPVVTGLTIAVHRSGSAECQPGPKILVLEGVKNPAWSGDPGPFALELRNGQQSAIAASGPVAGPLIEPFRSTIINGMFRPADALSATAARSPAAYNVQVNTSAPSSKVPANGFLSIRFPAGFDVSAATLPANALGACANLAPAAHAPNEVRGKLSADCGGTLPNFILGNVHNPGRAGTLGPAVVAFQNVDGIDLDQASFSLSLVPAALNLQAPSRLSGAAVVGELATYSLPFTTTNPIPADGRLVVTIPSGFGLAGASVPLWQGCGVAIGPVQVNLNVMTIQLAGHPADAPCPAGAPLTLRIADARNPARSGPTEPWVLETQLHDASPIDRSAPVDGPAMLMRGGGLSSVSLVPDDPLVGATTDILVTFHTSTAWAAQGKFEIEPPLGFGWTNPTALNSGAGGCEGTLSASVDGRRLSVARVGGTDCGTDTPHAIRFTGLVNGPTSGTLQPFHVATQTPEGYDLDATSTPGVTLAPAMDPASITPGNPSAGSTTTYSISFNSMVAWPKGGYLLAGFPAGTNAAALTLVGSTVCAGASAALATVASLPSNVVAVQLQTADCPAGVRGVTLGAVSNALTAGPVPIRLSLTGPVTSGHLPILSGSRTVSVVLTAALMTTPAPSLQVTPSAASHVAEYAFAFTARTALPVGGKVRATFPVEYDLEGALTARDAAGSSPAFTVAKSVGLVTASLTGATPWPAGAHTFVLAGIRNPTATGAAPSLKLEYLDSADVPFASATFTGPTLATAGDLESPSIPGSLTAASKLHATPAWTSGLTQQATWLPATDNVGVVGYSYAVDADPDLVAETSSPSATVTFPSDGVHTLRVRALDAAHNPGPIQTYQVQLDSVAPVLPAISADQGVTSCTTSATATVSWSAATDERSGLHATAPYRLAVGTGAPVVVTTNTGAVTLSKGSNNVTVTAQDAAGNTMSRNLTIKRDVDPPVATLVVPPFAHGPFEIRWNATDDCSGIKAYRVESRAGTNSAFTALYEGASNRTVVPAPLSDGTLYFRIRATDNVDHVGAIAALDAVSTVFDSSAPPAPDNLQAFPLAKGSVRLTWINVSEDGGSGLVGYNLYRADSLGAPFQKITLEPQEAATFTDTGRTNAQTYYYQVTAVDGAGNEGGHSLTAVVVADTRQIVTPSAVALSQLGNALDVPNMTNGLKAVDLDKDGRFDSLEDPSGSVHLDQQTTIDNKQALLLSGARTDALAVWVPSTDDVLPVERAAATILSKAEGNGTATVTIQVDKQEGWILINTTDTMPTRDLVGVAAADGRPIPLERVFRSDGFVRVLDDPEVTYDLLYDTTAGPLDAKEGLPVGSWTWAALASLGLLVVAGVVGAVMYRSRAKRQGAPPELADGTIPEAPTDDSVAQPSSSDSSMDEGPTVANDESAFADEPMESAPAMRPRTRSPAKGSSKRAAPPARATSSRKPTASRRVAVRGKAATRATKK